MTCACQMNAEETAIVQPCLAHARWAKTYAGQTWGDGKVDYAKQPQPAPRTTSRKFTDPGDPYREVGR